MVQNLWQINIKYLLTLVIYCIISDGVLIFALKPLLREYLPTSLFQIVNLLKKYTKNDSDTKSANKDKMYDPSHQVFPSINKVITGLPESIELKEG